MNRRNFVFKTAAVSSIVGMGSFAYSNEIPGGNKPSNSSKFKLNYAPGFEMFSESAGKNPIYAIKFFID